MRVTGSAGLVQPVVVKRPAIDAPNSKRTQPKRETVTNKCQTLTAEDHNGEQWLVLGDRLIARFLNDEARELFWQAHGRALLVAREVGRQGIG